MLILLILECLCLTILLILFFDLEGKLHNLNKGDSIEVEYYVSNKKKYLTFQGTVKKIDYIEKKIVFDSQKSIFIKDIFDIKLLSNEY